MSFSTIILAAGQGTRMQSSIPKVMHKLGSMPMIWYTLNTLAELDNLKECVMVVGDEMESLREYVRSKRPAVRFAVQEQRLGTGDAVRIGATQLEDSAQDTLVLYGDVPLLSAGSIKDMLNMLRENYEHTALVVLGFMPEGPNAFGRLVVNSHGNLERIAENLDCSDSEKEIKVCNHGAMLINGCHRDRLLAEIRNNNAKGEFYLTDLIAIANKHGLKCRYTLVDKREATAVNTRAELAKAEALLQAEFREKFLAAGVTLVDPPSTFFAGDTVIEPDVLIEPNVFIGPGVNIGSGARIKSFSHLEGAEIGTNCTVGPFARVRPGTKLFEGARVGNFVETKNSQIGAGSKINHLAYVGDATVGKAVNIGAGAITCNFDGVNKHHTVIEDGAFIGSNVALKAPVTVGKHALVAAGSVITKDVGRDDLAVSRAEQRNIAGGAKKVRSKHLNIGPKPM